MSKGKRQQVEIEMSQAELAGRVNKLLKVCNDEGFDPLTALFVLKAAQRHVEEAHGISVEEITFEKVAVQ